MSSVAMDHALGSANSSLSITYWLLNGKKVKRIHALKTVETAVETVTKMWICDAVQQPLSGIFDDS